MDIPTHLRLTVKVEEDRRYRIFVRLQRADRPKYWVFNCPNCRHTITEVINADMIGMADLADTSNMDTVGVGRRCDSCHFWYYFLVN